jgi:hypothetical protein
MNTEKNHKNKKEKEKNSGMSTRIQYRYFGLGPLKELKPNSIPGL